MIRQRKVLSCANNRPILPTSQPNKSQSINRGTSCPPNPNVKERQSCCCCCHRIVILCKGEVRNWQGLTINIELCSVLHIRCQLCEFYLPTKLHFYSCWAVMSRGINGYRREKERYENGKVIFLFVYLISHKHSAQDWISFSKCQFPFTIRGETNFRFYFSFFFFFLNQLECSFQMLIP